MMRLWGVIILFSQRMDKRALKPYMMMTEMTGGNVTLSRRLDYLKVEVLEVAAAVGRVVEGGAGKRVAQGARGTKLTALDNQELLDPPRFQWKMGVVASTQQQRGTVVQLCQVPLTWVGTE